MPSQKNILYAIDPPLHMSGGVSVLAICLIKAFSATHNVHLLSGDSQDELEKLGVAGHLTSHIEWKPPLGPPRPAFLKYVRELSRQIADKKIDLVNFHSGMFNWGNRLYGFSLPRQLKRRNIPSIWTSHGIFSVLKGYCGPKKPLLFKLAMFPLGWLGKFDQLRHTELEIQVSQFDLQTIKAFWFPLSKKCIQIYHSKIDSPELASLERSKTILNVGYISYNKRQELLAEAFIKIAPDYPEWQLVFAGRDAGDGCFDFIKSKIKQAGLEERVHYLGHVADPSTLMMTCGIYVHSSDYEGLPLAVQEAMHFGCPIIGSSIPGHRELLELNSAGLIFQQGDAADLTKKLLSLLENPSLREDLSRKARADVSARKMSLIDMVRSYETVYGEVLKSR